MSNLKHEERARNLYEQAMSSEDREQRIPLLKRAVSLDPEFSDAYMELGSSYIHINDLEEADKALRASIELDDNVWAHLYLGNLFERKNDLVAALNEFHAAEKVDPELSVSLWCAGDIHRAMGDLDESERYYRKAIAAEPTDALALARLGRLLIEKGNRTEGAAYIKRALEEDSACNFALKCKSRYHVE